ncbi:choice-of-anchor Q domain-containing protein [Olleya sp. R77988]|uniref:choice-of-anchor Q domain-containing protein n=1 Tax=Olleya sp. R77988 TaxID=3093875 RepID=UPI0037C8AAC5
MKTRLLLMLLITSSYTFAQIPTTDLVAEYLFTNGSLINNANPGTNDLVQTGTTSSFVNDPLDQAGNAIQFVTDNFNGDSRGDRYNVSVSFWIKTVNNNGYVKKIIEQYGDSGFGPYGWRVQLIDGKIRLRSKFTNGGTDFKEVVIETQVIADNTWHHIAFTAEKKQEPGYVSYGYLNKLYVDNIQVATGVDYTNGGDSFLNSSISSNPTFNHTISLSESTNSNFSFIDNIRVYNRDITTTEVKELYKEYFSSLSRLYVNKNATGTGIGNSWANGFTDLQRVLSVVDNQEVWVAAGVYKPHANDRTISFDINKPNVSIYGGFEGNETQLADRVLNTNETIFSGDLLGNDVNLSDFPSNYSNSTRNTDNSYHVLKVLNGGENLLLDGLTFSDAHNNLNATEKGGAIVKFNQINKLKLVNCTIKDNVSRNENSGLLAELFVVGSSSRAELVVENCKFINNMSRAGSAIYSVTRSNTSADINIINCLFEANLVSDLNTTTATGLSGSASWFRTTGSSGIDVSLNLVNNTYVNNVDLGTGSSLNATNRATVAISKFNSTTITYNYNAQVSNCIFWNNTTTGGVTTKAISDQFEIPVTSLTVSNSLDALNFNDSSITSSNNSITADPIFTSTTDFTLQGSSPAIDSGDNSYVIGTNDLLGNQRVFGPTVDIGAYEYSSALSTDVFELNENDIKLYPNPTTTLLNIKMNSNLKRATIYSVFGTKVLETTFKSITTTNLANGLYLIEIEAENGSIFTKKFLKR